VNVIDPKSHNKRRRTGGGRARASSGKPYIHVNDISRGKYRGNTGTNTGTNTGSNTGSNTRTNTRSPVLTGRRYGQERESCHTKANSTRTGQFPCQTFLRRDNLKRCLRTSPCQRWQYFSIPVYFGWKWLSFRLPVGPLRFPVCMTDLRFRSFLQTKLTPEVYLFLQHFPVYFFKMIRASTTFKPSPSP